MKLKGGDYFLLVIMGFMMLVIISAVRMPYMSSKVLPLVFGGFIFVLAAIQFGRELKVQVKSQPEREEGEKDTSSGVRPYLFAGVWMGGLLLGIYVLGCIVAISLFVVAYMKLHGTKWFSAIVYAIGTGALVYAIFVSGLEIDLYSGLLGWL